MALWICRGCTAAYAVGAPACPQCGSSEYEEEHNMPKISRASGVTYEPGHVPDGVAEPQDSPTEALQPEEQPAPKAVKRAARSKATEGA